MTPTTSTLNATDDLISVSEVAAILKIHVSSVYRLIDSGRLPAHAFGEGKIRRRGIRVWRSSVDQLMQGSRVTAAAA
jgi:excisionase family DNA binding protein